MEGIIDNFEYKIFSIYNDNHLPTIMFKDLETKKIYSTSISFLNGGDYLLNALSNKPDNKDKLVCYKELRPLNDNDDHLVLTNNRHTIYFNIPLFSNPNDIFEQKENVVWRPTNHLDDMTIGDYNLQHYAYKKDKNKEEYCVQIRKNLTGEQYYRYFNSDEAEYFEYHKYLNHYKHYENNYNDLSFIEQYGNLYIRNNTESNHMGIKFEANKVQKCYSQFVLKL